MLSTSPRRRAAAPASRLDLTIGRTTYEVAPLAAPAAGSTAFRLTKRDGTSYDVAQTEFGPECDCPDYIFRRDGLDPQGCKHIQALASFGMIGGQDGFWD